MEVTSSLLLVFYNPLLDPYRRPKEENKVIICILCFFSCLFFFGDIISVTFIANADGDEQFRKVYSYFTFFMVFHWSLNNKKSPQVFRTLLNILTNPKNALAWMVSDFKLFQAPFQSFGDRSKGTNYIWYHRQPHVQQLS